MVAAVPHYFCCLIIIPLFFLFCLLGRSQRQTDPSPLVHSDQTQTQPQQVAAKLYKGQL